MMPSRPLVSDWLIWLNCFVYGLLGVILGLVLLVAFHQVLEKWL